MEAFLFFLAIFVGICTAMTACVFFVFVVGSLMNHGGLIAYAMAAGLIIGLISAVITFGTYVPAF